MDRYRKNRQPTIVDVAAAAGVSRTTASDALNGRGRVDTETRKRVTKAAAALGYRANLSARRLRSGTTGILALFLPSMEAVGEETEALSLDYYMRLTGSAAASAFGRGYALVLVPPLDGPEQLQDVPFDGAIVADPETGDPRLTRLDEIGLPVVTVERDLARGDDRWYVASDTVHNTRTALDHLAEQGAARIALLCPEAQWAWAIEATETYESWSRRRRRETIVVSVPMRHLEGSAYDAARRLLDRPDRPDAIVTLADRYAPGALRAASEHGLRVPDDLMILAGVDSDSSGALQPGITALDLHPERQAALAVAMLTGRLAGEVVEAPQVLQGELIVRRSTQRNAAPD